MTAIPQLAPIRIQHSIVRARQVTPIDAAAHLSVFQGGASAMSGIDQDPASRVAARYGRVIHRMTTGTQMTHIRRSSGCLGTAPDRFLCLRRARTIIQATHIQ